MPVKALSHTTGAGDCVRLDALVAKLCAMPRGRARGLIAFGGVNVNGDPQGDPALLLRAGDVLQVRFEPGRKYKEPRAERATRGFSQVYLDDDLIVVDKEPGILTVPTPNGEANTLVSLISRHLAKGQKRHRPVSVVHRLDRETSGLLVFGRTPVIARQLSDQFAAHKPEREYVTIVSGVVKDDSGTLRSHLVTDKSLNRKSDDSGRGELAVTHFKVLRRGRDWTSLSVRLETGRRNQIRIHMAELGHPVLGDERYADEQAKVPRGWPVDRLALHARVLGFIHPKTKAPLRFQSPLPAVFAVFV